MQAYDERIHARGPFHSMNEIVLASDGLLGICLLLGGYMYEAVTLAVGASPLLLSCTALSYVYMKARKFPVIPASRGLPSNYIS
jgi:hypothetical protein